MSDGRSAPVEQRVTVRVTSQDVNGDPTVISTAPRGAVAGRTYRYQLVGDDPDGDVISWSLEDPAPDGMTLDPDTGVLIWTPRVDQISTSLDRIDGEVVEVVTPHPVRVRAHDAYGGVSAPHDFEITVRGANLPPRIESDPPTRAARNAPYVYQVRAVDPEGDALVYELADRPSGMTIDPESGRIEWIPSASLPLGPLYEVTVRVTDSFGDSVERDPHDRPVGDRDQPAAGARLRSPAIPRRGHPLRRRRLGRRPGWRRHDDHGPRAVVALLQPEHREDRGHDDRRRPLQRGRPRRRRL